MFDLKKKLSDGAKTTRFSPFFQTGMVQHLQFSLKEIIMSAISVPISEAQVSFRLFERFRQFVAGRRARHRAIRELNNLSDRALHDLGVDRPDIDAAVDREIGKLRLDEFRSRG